MVKSPRLEILPSARAYSSSPTTSCLKKLERGLPTPKTFDEKTLRDAGVGSYAPPVLHSPFAGGPSGFAKYGKRDHIRASFERGVFRITPASSYLDPSLNSAQADQELEHAVVTPNEQLLNNALRAGRDRE